MRSRLRAARASGLSLALLMALVVGWSGQARAQAPAPDDSGARDELPAPGSSWFWSDGAVPFIYAPLALTALVHFLVEPPEEPRFFSPQEGGKPFSGDTIPEVVIAGYVAAGALATAILPSDDSNYHHAKGILSAAMTTLAVTELTKNAVGRRRPHFDDASDLDQRRSFFSGHASMTFVTSTYLGIYLHDHVFAGYRDPGQAFAWWEVLPLGALAAGSTAVVLTRLDDNRHHRSDVIMGAVVGTAAAVGFYTWHEMRYRRDKRRHGDRPSRVSVLPTFDRPGLVLQGSF